ncbi:DNA processing protein, SMF family [Metamycoplasma phocicerebrale]|uniref:DNA processing protein, SMF family n=1 Tax=Metamycoplasma phocicerebrale TaxID=142649 RepID=A0A3T0TTC0_9BACT|nr:DNA-processing protein DprA [Metamycoplasma phocicerebrale]AZZ65283.1 DNA processing protein, SMF family [Metamycoplasma phocicerebrale]
MNELLLYFNYKYKGDWNKIYNAIKQKEQIKEEDYKNFINQINTNNEKYITILDSDYPQKLLANRKPPFVLHYKGNLEILTKAKKIVYLTGSYETLNINKYVNKISRDFETTFINLYWNGLEQSILKQLLNKQVKVIVILPCGINWAIKNLNLNYYLDENCLFLSEYPNEYHITKIAYSARSRINAGLCHKMILLSSLEYKYNNIINEFLDQGKDIQCLLFKDHLENDQNIDLINQGAELVSENKPIC